MNTNKLTNFMEQNYGIYEEEYKLLGNNENIVYSNKDKIIRVTSKKHRSAEELNIELSLLEILNNNGCDVNRIIRSNQNKLFELLKTSNGNSFVSVFEKANGSHINIYFNDEGKKIINIWGESMGKIHDITSKYYSKIDHSKRLSWDTEIIIEKAEELVPSKDSQTIEILNRIKSILYNTDRNYKNYGLVHTDMRPRNFFYKNGNICHFDFDDICNHWYAYDIAVAAFHETENYNNITDRNNFINRFLYELIKGYSKYKSISGIGLNNLYYLILLRCIYAYIDYYKRLKIKGIDSGMEKMKERREFILNFENFISQSGINETINKFNS